MLNGNHKQRVVIDTLSARRGGGESYLRNLLEHWQGNPYLEVFVLTSDSLSLPAGNGKAKQISVRWPVENPFLRAIWARVSLRRLLSRLQAQVFFSPGGVVLAQPPVGCKTVTMFRNMLPFDVAQRKAFPFGLERMRLWILKRTLLRAMAGADLVIFVSEFGRKVIEAELRERLKGAVVIPHGVSACFRAAADDRRTLPDKAPGGQYLLYVSWVAPHKAHLEVIRGYALLKQRRLTKEKLLLVGWELPAYAAKVRQEISRLGLRDDVLLLGSVPPDELPSLYQHAVVNIFASECENCPNTLLEAMAAGRPIVCSSRPPMPEFAGNAAIYFDPSSAQDLAEKLLGLLNHPHLLDDFARRARERSLLFDWGKTADLTWQAIAGLVQEGKCERAS
jgi:glycosyltransferase involved in cell wall biosynthesis